MAVVNSIFIHVYTVSQKVGDIGTYKILANLLLFIIMSCNYFNSFWKSILTIVSTRIKACIMKFWTLRAIKRNKGRDHNFTKQNFFI